MSFFDSLMDGISSTFSGFSDIWSGRNPFTKGGGFFNLFKGAADDLQDFAEGYTGERMSKKNLEFQKKQFEYQKMLNEKQMQREDTAYQRKVADMTKAGFNPILATGGSGSPSTALHAGPAPQLSDYSGGIREGVGQIANAVFQAISMKKDFAQKDAQIKLLQSEKDKADAEAAGIRTENEYKSDWLRLRNENASLDNQLKSGTLQYNINLAASKLSLSQKEELIKDMELMLGNADLDLKEVDLEIKRLIKEGKITENDILDKKLEILTTEALQKALDLSNAEWNTDWYHGLNLPVDFNAGWMGQLGLMLGGLGERGINFIIDFISAVYGNKGSEGSEGSDKPDKPRKFTKAELKQLLRRPVSSNSLWNKRMQVSGDYGVRRNF